LKGKAKAGFFHRHGNVSFWMAMYHLHFIDTIILKNFTFQKANVKSLATIYETFFSIADIWGSKFSPPVSYLRYL